MASLAKKFVPEIQSCNEVIGSGSCLLVASVPNCGEEPILYTISNTVAASISTTATTLTLSVTGATQDGVAVTPTPTSVLIREGAVLYFGATNVAVKVSDEVLIATATVVNVDSIPAAIAVNDVANTWALYLLETVTDLPIALEAGEADSKVLKDGIQGSNVQTRIDLNLAISYLAAPTDIAQARVMLRAATNTEDIFFFAAKSSSLVAWGRAKVMGLTESGDMELTTYSTTLSAQAPFAVTYKTADTQVNSSNQLIDLNLALRYAGLPIV
jgi:hypothetical protein